MEEDCWKLLTEIGYGHSFLHDLHLIFAMDICNEYKKRKTEPPLSKKGNYWRFDLGLPMADSGSQPPPKQDESQTCPSPTKKKSFAGLFAQEQVAPQALIPSTI